MEPLLSLFSESLAEALRTHGKHICLVTGRSFLSELGLLQKLYSFLRYHGFKVYVFDKVPPEPGDDVVRTGADKFLENGCDVLLAVGGGSVMDAAKGIAILAANDGAIYAYKNLTTFPKPPFPVIAAPTTCGSGSETTRYAVFSNREPKEKFTIKSLDIIPAVAVLDPTLLHSLPDDELVVTAFDASSHLIETVLFNRTSTPASVDRAFAGLAQLLGCLREAFETRTDVLLGRLMAVAHLAGSVINEERTGLPHTIGNKISGFMAIKHGRINSLAIPPCLAFLEERDGEDALFSERMKRFEQMLATLNLWRGSVSMSLAAFYGAFPGGGHGPARFSEATRAAIVEQTARDTGLFDITPLGLEKGMLPAILEGVIEAINEDC